MSTKTITLLAVVTVVVIGIAGIGDWLASAAPAEVLYFDLVVDGPRQLLYGSDKDGGTIQVISQGTLQVIDEVSVGSGPAGIDIKPDGTELAVALSGEGEIAFVDLDTLTIITRTVPAGVDGPNQPWDVLYGRAGRLYSTGSPGSSGFDYVHVFDSGTREELGRSSTIVRAAPRLAITADHNTLYVGESLFSPDSLSRFDITSDSPALLSQAPFASVSVYTVCVLSDGRVVTSGGQVLPADLASVLETLPNGGPAVECNDKYGRVFIADGVGETLSIFEASDYGNIASVDLEGQIGAISQDGLGESLYLSTEDGLRVFGADISPVAYLPAILHNFCPGFSDDFSDPASGWPEGDYDLFITGYLDGEYRLKSKESGYFYLIESPSCRRESYVVELDARWQGTPGSGLGILFGIDGDPGSFYVFDINTDRQRFRLLHWGPGGWDSPVSARVSYLIKRGNATNHLKVSTHSSEITLAINGTIVHVLTDPRIIGITGAGIVSQPASDQPSSDARFDNFSMVQWSPGAGPARGSTDAVELAVPERNRSGFMPSDGVPDWEFNSTGQGQDGTG